ncbi:MAG TPA: hypothetical protein VID29_10565 [Solirubrobacteraceae bacterium]
MGLLLLCGLVGLFAGWLVSGAGVAVAGDVPGWSTSSLLQPSSLVVGATGQSVVVLATNTGGGVADGAIVPISVSVRLPEHVTATAIEGTNTGIEGGAPGSTLNCSLATSSCSYTGVVTPGGVLRIEIGVQVEAGSHAQAGAVGVSGGGAPAGVSVPIADDVGGATAFGVSAFAIAPSSVAAGAHADLTTSMNFNESEVEVPARDPRSIDVELPPGLVGDPLAVPRCDMRRVNNNTCPADTAVGVATVSIAQSAVGSVLLYNIAPNPNEPAAFAFSLVVPVRLDTSLRRNANGEYRIVASVGNAAEASVFTSASITLWGVPADHAGPGPDTTAGTGIGERHSYGGPDGSARVPFMSNPTSCGGPVGAGLSLVSWPYMTQEGVLLAPEASSASTTLGGFTGCGRLVFDPSFSAAADSPQAGEPAGLSVNIGLPQNENPDGLAAPQLRDAVVTLPPGVVVSPSAADGLQACSEAQVALASDAPAHCPEESQIGTALVETPLLAKPLRGSLFLASQDANPFHSLLAMYLVVEGAGVVVKLAGQTHTDPATGQLSASFLENPQVPVSAIHLHFNGGTRAPLANPRACGAATSTAQLTPWSGGVPAVLASGYEVREGCPTGAFAPSFEASMASAQAGAFSPFSVTFARSDMDGILGGVSVKTPPGLLGILKGVVQCPEPQAAEGKCSPASLIGHTTVGAGPGATPFYLGGQVFLTGPYRGAPFGLSIVVPAIAGPFNLGDVVVRAQIAVDPNTSQLTIVSDPLPTIIDGIPLQVRTVHVTVDRPGFTFNPTNCAPLAVQGTLGSTEGAVSQSAYHFQVANCQSLPFNAKLTPSTQAKTSRANGASLQVKLSYTAGGANIHSVAVTLPKQLPARLSTIQQACLAATFQSNPASCPPASLIGTATASTPILANPLTGPAYLVSHGGAAFPDIVIVLEGEGIRFDLTGNINITKAGITSSTFANVPDAPITSFKLVLPEGPHSGLAAVGSLCAKPLKMPVTITAQSGAQIKQNATIATVGCPAKRTKSKKK